MACCVRIVTTAGTVHFVVRQPIRASNTCRTKLLVFSHSRMVFLAMVFLAQWLSHRRPRFALLLLTSHSLPCYLSMDKL